MSSTGTADFTADVSKDGSSIAWQLSYAGSKEPSSSRTFTSGSAA